MPLRTVSGQDPTQVTRSFCESLLRCEIGSICSRMASAVAQFFTVLARYICCCQRHEENTQVQRLNPERVTIDPPEESNSVNDSSTPSETGEIMTTAIEATPPAKGVEKHPIEAIGNLSPNQRDNIDEILEPLSADQRESVVQCALPLITPDPKMSDYGKCAIIGAIAALSADKRKEIVDYACKHLIAPGMDGFDKGHVIEAIGNLSSDERDNLKEALKQLITPLTKNYSMGEAVQILARLPADQRESVVHYALRLITDEMSGYGKCAIIRNIVAFPDNKRKEIVDYACKHLIAPGMDGFDKGHVIEAIGNLSSDERDNLKDALKQLITDKTKNYGMGKAVQILARLPADQRENVVRYALRLITDEMSGDGRRAIIDAIAAHPVNKREKIVERVLREKVTPKMDGFVIATIIKLTDANSIS